MPLLIVLFSGPVGHNGTEGRPGNAGRRGFLGETGAPGFDAMVSANCHSIYLFITVLSMPSKGRRSCHATFLCRLGRWILTDFPQKSSIYLKNKTKEYTYFRIHSIKMYTLD